MRMKMLGLCAMLACQGVAASFDFSAQSMAAPDDSATARNAAIARLRSAPAQNVCRDTSVASQTYGTTCASREFPAPPMLEAPKFRWTVNPGWWSVWSPFLIGNKVLTGSCNNEDNKGLSAFDMRTGKTLWRISGICNEGNRAGSMGQAAFYEETVLFILGRDDGKPTDFYVVDVKAGKILRNLKPVKRGGTKSLDGVFMVITQSEKDKTTYLNGLNAEMDRILWRHDLFRYKCYGLDRDCLPVFTPGAGHDGIQYFSITAKDQPDPPTRQLHAFDVQSGKLLWKNSDQPVANIWNSTDYRSDDGSPLVADGKVITKITRLTDRRLGSTDIALRAQDARTGAGVWTSAPIAEWADGRKVLKMGNRIASGDTLIVEIERDSSKDLLGYRLADGKLMWRRPAYLNTMLTASAGGMFLVAESTRTDTEQIIKLQGLDGQTGTLLWSTNLPGHNLPFTGEWGIDDMHSSLLQGPSWRIGPDGAIYGITLKGVYKLQ
jgi:outer membrane protein assembly factor BamB